MSDDPQDHMTRVISDPFSNFLVDDRCDKDCHTVSHMTWGVHCTDCALAREAVVTICPISARPSLDSGKVMVDREDLQWAFDELDAFIQNHTDDAPPTLWPLVGVAKERLSRIQSLLHPTEGEG